MKRRFVYVFVTAGIALLALTLAQLQFPFSRALLRPAPMAQEFRLEEVASIAEISPANLKPDTIAFSDYRNDQITDAKSGLIRFVDWAKAKSLKKRLLSLYPGYDEPTITATVGGATKTMKRRLHIYVAEARFELARAPNAIDLTRYLNLAFLERMDPAIKHQLISADDVTPNKDARLVNNNPNRRWCEGVALPVRRQAPPRHFTTEQAAREWQTDRRFHRVRKRAADHPAGRDRPGCARPVDRD
jgi:hypothetical protein